MVHSRAVLTEAENQAEKLVNQSMRVQENRVITGIPWISAGGAPHLPNNRSMAERRLYNLERSLARQEAVYAEYRHVIQSYLAKGYIRRCDSNVSTDDQWLLPHFPVVRHQKETTKVRVVFDAAARCDGRSLNDEMFAGPKLQRDLTHVLLRFCLEPVALVGILPKCSSKWSCSSMTESMFASCGASHHRRR